ncbi:MAG: lipoprotein-releasing ABC transporter permease subunit [Candidatus Omnitrophica bacterium]|nr:lipoprotein-releasing ABC transporter permease subunit [Candidatus Omnitrophota bacterium]
MKVELFIALRYLLRRKKAGFISLISLISVLGVAVGVMALIVVLSVMSGFDRELKSKIVGINPHVVINKSGGIEDYEEVIHQIRAMGLDKITTISPYVIGQAIIRSDSNALGVMVKAVDPAREDITFLKKFLKAGNLDFSVPVIKEGEEQIQGSVVIGRTLAHHLFINEGDIVNIISPLLEKKGLFGAAAKTETFRVSGIFQFGMYDVDSTFVLMRLDHAQELYQLGNKVTGLSIKLSDVYWAERIKEILRGTLNFNYWIQTWIDMNRNFFSALKVEKNVMAILLFLIILVAAFNIISTLIMVVMEKTKDIGVLKSLGVTKAAIRNIFIFEGAIVGVVGTTLGVGAGLMVTRWLNPIADFIEMATGFEVFPSDIYYFDRIPTQTNSIDVIVIAAFAFIITIMASVYPAKRAASLKPVDALRYE